MKMPDKNYSDKDFKFNGSLILKLYDNKCCICSKVKDWMEIHHIDKRNDNNDLTNLVPVCKDCHMMVHSRKFVMKLQIDHRVLEVGRMIENLLKSSPMSN